MTEKKVVLNLVVPYDIRADFVTEEVINMWLGEGNVETITFRIPAAQLRTGYLLPGQGVSPAGIISTRVRDIARSFGKHNVRPVFEMPQDGWPDSAVAEALKNEVNLGANVSKPETSLYEIIE